MSSENDSPLSPSPPSPKITTPVVNKPRQIIPPPPTTTTTTTKDPPPPPPPKTSTTTSTSTTKEPLPPPPTTKEPLPPPPTTKSLPPPATTITSTLPIITPSIPATTTTPLTTSSTSGTTTQSEITTDNTAAGVNGNEGNYGNGTSSNIIIPAIILATLVASAFIGYFVYRKVKVIKESRSSRSFFENLDNIGPNASGPAPLDKRRPSSVVFSRILNYNLSSNNNNNNNKKFNNSASPTRLITENNTSSGFRRNNNNEVPLASPSRLIRTTSPIQTSQPRNNYHQNYQQRNLQQQQQPNFYNQAPLPSSISPSGFIPPSSNFPPHPPPLYPLQYNNPQQQPSPPPALHVQNRFVNNNNSFTQQGSFNYAPVNDVNSYPTSGRLVRVPVQVNKQYNEPVNYTNDYNGYNNQHITTMNQGNFDDSGNFKNDIDDNGREIDNNMKKEEKLGSVLPTIITTAPSVEDDSVSL